MKFRALVAWQISPLSQECGIFYLRSAAHNAVLL
jgi:hypothetical protein